MAQRQFKSTDTSIWSEKFGNGSDGVGSINTSTFAEANETFTGTSGELTGTAGGTSISDNDLVLIHQTQRTGAGAWELNKVTSGGGSANLTFKYALCNTYTTGAQILKLKQYSALTVNSGQTWTSSTWNGSKGSILAFLCNGLTTVTGAILGTGIGYRLGSSSGSDMYHGEGQLLPSGTTQTGSGGHPGDSGAVTGGGGGGGGNGAAGTNGADGSTPGVGGPGGDAVGVASLITFYPGGGGGHGGPGNGGSIQAGDGAAGGACIFIISKTIIITGSIAVNGNVGANATGSSGGGGGGGAGGSVLLKVQNATLGSNLITASGGGGGSGQAGGGNGGAGAVGRIHADYKDTITGTTSPTIDTTQDSSLSSGGGTFLLNFC